MTRKLKVVCPHCGSDQEEPMGAISTYCHSCKRHIPIKDAPKRKAAVIPRNTRTVICRECGCTDKIVAGAQSSQCENCSVYLDLRSYTIKGKSNQKIVTYGDVTFAPGCNYEGPPVRAGKIIIDGRVSAVVQADEELEIQGHAKVWNPIHSPVIRIAQGADVTVPRIQTRLLEVAAQIRLEEVVASEKILVQSGGMLIAQRIAAPVIEVQPGGALLGRLEIAPPEVPAEEAG